MNTLYYGDNLKFLRYCIREDSFGMLSLKPGAQAPSPASVRKDADRAEDNSSSVIPGAVTPEEPALQAWEPAFPGYRVIGQPEGPRWCKGTCGTAQVRFPVADGLADFGRCRKEKTRSVTVVSKAVTVDSVIPAGRCSRGP